MDTLLRPTVSPKRDRELDNLAMQLMLQCPADLGEVLIVKDKCEEILNGWIKKHLDAGLLDHLRSGQAAHRKSSPLRVVE